MRLLGIAWKRVLPLPLWTAAIKPVLLDLFCGAGGAAVGYARAGFDVVGVDIRPQPRYPFEFFQADALEVLKTWGVSTAFDAIHASPPCQGYSRTNALHRNIEYPMLIADVRTGLEQTGLPWVIENVEDAHREMRSPVMLCGSQFGRYTIWPGNGRVVLRRHRAFECSFPVPDPGPHDHSCLSVPVYGHGVGQSRRGIFKETKGCAQAAREVMGIDWMTYRELCESIPPVYTEYIGKYLMDAIATPLAA